MILKILIGLGGLILLPYLWIALCVWLCDIATGTENKFESFIASLLWLPLILKLKKHKLE